MRKKAFTIIEVIAVFLLILGTTFLILPKILDNTRQAKFISKWTQAYSEMEYIASVIKAQNDPVLKKRMEKANDNFVMGELALETLKPYLRIKMGVAQSQYKPIYMNKEKMNNWDRYYFDSFFLTEENKIVALKWLNKDCREKTTCGILFFDINGTEQPNTWGRDVFGLNILKNGIEPIGKNVDPVLLKTDCSKLGTGVYCSYFYLIGGDFD